MDFDYLKVGLVFLVFTGCAQRGSNFSNATPPKVALPEAVDAVAEVDPGYGYLYEYLFEIKDFDTVVPVNKDVTFSPKVIRILDKGLDTDSSLSKEQLQEWEVLYSIDNSPLFNQPQKLADTVFNFSEFKGNSGYKILNIDFNNQKYAKKFRMSVRIYIDEQAPNIFFNLIKEIDQVEHLSWQKNRDNFGDSGVDISGMMLSWSVNDDIAPDERSYGIFLCQDSVIQGVVNPYDLVGDGGCKMEYDSTAIFEILAQQNGKKLIEIVKPLDEALEERSSATYIFYAKDMVGNQNYQVLSNSKIDRSRLLARLIPIRGDESKIPLAVDSKDSTLYYSKDRNIRLLADMQVITEKDPAGLNVAVETAIEQEWRLQFSNDKITYNEFKFSDSESFSQESFNIIRKCEQDSNLECKDLDEFHYFVSGNNLQSPSEHIRIKYDNQKPKVYDVNINVENNLLVKGSKVSINWKIDDPEGSPLRGYQVTIRRLSDLERKNSNSMSTDYHAETYHVFFDENSTIATTELSSHFIWGVKGVYDNKGNRTGNGDNWDGNTSPELFDVFISVIDAAGNTSEVASKRYFPQIFNAAMVTQDVKCLFCHLHVYGDIVGIDFPEDPHGGPGTIHGKAGLGVLVEGKIIANNDLPYNQLPGEISDPVIEKWAKNRFKDSAIFGYTSNYDEETEKVRYFPRDQDGKIGMPDIEPDSLRKKMSGTLRFQIKDKQTNQSKPFFIERNYSGNVFISGDKNNPIQISGEVFIEGSIILKGYFEGRGTIYAHNIFIVDDLIAKDSPFPFPKPNYKDGNFDPARKRAIEILRNEPKYDSLYLGAILTEEDRTKNKNEVRSGQITVGGPGRYDWSRVFPFKYSYPGYKGNPGKAVADLSKTENRYVGGEEGYLGLGVLNSYEDYKALGSQLDLVRENRNGTIKVYGRDDFWPGHALKHIDVSRVDSYLYAATGLAWQQYSNILLNGGFMAPDVKLTSALVHKFVGNTSGSDNMNYTQKRYDLPKNTDPLVWDLNLKYKYPWKILNSNTDGYSVATEKRNPKNNMPMFFNWIRYDFRLQVGGPGFESLREYFNYSNQHLDDNEAKKIDLPETCDPFLDPNCTP